MEQLAKIYLEAPKLPQVRDLSERKRILGGIETAFKQAGIDKLVTRTISVAAYTKAGDPFHFDFGYRTGEALKLFMRCRSVRM